MVPANSISFFELKWNYKIVQTLQIDEIIGEYPVFRARLCDNRMILLFLGMTTK
jgi:hypothetical protein